MVRVVALDAPGDEAAALAEATTLLLRGELVILPTDTLYALSCRVEDEAAVGRVREAKGRDEAKPLPLIAADLDQLRGLVEATRAAALARSFWPGPLTLVLQARPSVPRWITSGRGSVAVRVPAHAFLRRLCARVGPLVSTSANRGGEEPPRTCAEALAGVGAWAALALDAGPGGALPSTIVDLVGPEPRLLRAGVVPWADVLRALRP
jgi:tRNA threonylcarbamoyl adenosine modification protein (Sua5/YciO/YrdC/YwlC family)